MAREEIFNPNIKGIRKFTDALAHWGGRLVMRMQTSPSVITTKDVKLLPAVGVAHDAYMNPVVTNHYVQKHMKQQGMTEKAVVGEVAPLPLAPTDEELQQQFDLPAVRPDQRNTQPPEQGNK